MGKGTRVIGIVGACSAIGVLGGCANQVPPSPATITVTAPAPTPSVTSIYDEAAAQADEACQTIAQYNSTIGMGSPETIPGMKTWLPQAKSLLESAAAGDPKYDKMSSSAYFLYYAVPEWEPAGNYPDGSNKSDEMILKTQPIMDAFGNLVSACADNFR